MYSVNKKIYVFHKEIESSLLEFVEHGNKQKLLDRIKFYSDMEVLYIKYIEKYFVKLLEISSDEINFTISIDCFL
jgi:hypothetical protein